MSNGLGVFTVLLRIPRTAPFVLVFCFACNIQSRSTTGKPITMRKSLCLFANSCLDCGLILHSHSFHKPNMLSAHDYRFPFWGMTVTLNIDDSYPQQVFNPGGIRIVPLVFYRVSQKIFPPLKIRSIKSMSGI